MHTVANYDHDTHAEKIHEGHRIRLVIDEFHETRGSYAYETEEETREAEDLEIEKLESGEWIVLARINEKQCDACGEWSVEDSIFGIVVENSADGWLCAAFEA